MYAVYCCCSKVNWCKPVNGRHAFPRSLAAPQRILAEPTLEGQPSSLKKLQNLSTRNPNNTHRVYASCIRYQRRTINRAIMSSIIFPSRLTSPPAGTFHARRAKLLRAAVQSLTSEKAVTPLF